MQTLACDRRVHKDSVSVLWHDKMTAFTSVCVNCYKYSVTPLLCCQRFSI